jgi:hypothetical protein
VQFPKWLIANGFADSRTIESVTHDVDMEVAEATDRALKADPPPKGSSLRHLYSERIDPTSSEFDAVAQFAGEPRTMVDEINLTLHEEMRRNDRMLVFGEDVADCSREANLPEVKGKGGVFKATQGLQIAFGSRRCFNSPIAEASIVGRAIGEKLTALAWNRDPREIKIDRRAGSAGAQSAIGRKPAEERIFRPILLHLADRICTRLRAKSKPGRTVTVRVRFANLESSTRSLTLDAPISATVILAEIAEELVRAVLADHPDKKTISLLAISVSHLEEHWDVQLELPLGLKDEARRPGTKKGMARWVADCAVDRIRGRFGWDAIGYASVALGISRSVPDEFRKLAEKDL